MYCAFLFANCFNAGSPANKPTESNSYVLVGHGSEHINRSSRVLNSIFSMPGSSSSARSLMFLFRSSSIFSSRNLILSIKKVCSEIGFSTTELSINHLTKAHNKFRQTDGALCVRLPLLKALCKYTNN